MIAFAAVMLDELVHCCPEMPLPQRNHTIQTLLLNRSYEPLRALAPAEGLRFILHRIHLIRDERPGSSI
jgi:hypothetical protein